MANDHDGTTVTKADMWEALKDEFGFNKFRPGQLETCLATLKGRDTVFLAPTGAGKSLCYQLPGLEMEGVTVVVCPLISLAEDQAAHLREAGFGASILNSSRSAKQVAAEKKRLRSGRSEFVFTTPERLQNTGLCEELAEIGVDLMVVDEAHCASQWGHDFRPDYLGLRHARRRLGNPPVLAMTATASPRTLEDVVDSLGLDDPKVVATGIDRPNLSLDVRPAAGDAAKRQELSRLLSGQGGVSPATPAIVYCATVKQADAVHEFLDAAGAVALKYHGRMKAADRTTSQRAFMEGPAAVMAATNAFGMGIDKPDIRQVIHYACPGSLEAYYQEVGRAGRDGGEAVCTLLFDRDDLDVRKMFAGGHLKSEELMTAWHNLKTAAGDAGGAKLSDVAAVSPYGRTKLKRCFQMLAGQGIVAPAGRGRWECVASVVVHATLDRIAEGARRRAEDRRIAVEQMAQFAESAGDRWAVLREHFAVQEIPAAAA